MNSRLTNNMLTLWELCHRLANTDPYKRHPFGLPSNVKDNIRLLLNEILHNHLESSLLMSKWREGLNTTPDMHIRYYLDEIYPCIAGTEFKPKFLKSIGIDRSAFRYWCDQSGHPLPDFWFSVNYKHPADDDDLEEELNNGEVADHPEKLTPAQRRKVCCQVIAESLWRQNKDTTIADMMKNKDILLLGGGNHYAEKTLRKWLSAIAPPEVSEKRGRPPKIKKTSITDS